MALKNLQSLVLRVVAPAIDHGTGLDGKVRAVPQTSAFLSYPRPYSPRYFVATETRVGRGSADKCGTALAVVRAGRPGCWADSGRHNLARNPRGTILSRWSRPLEPTATPRLGFIQGRMPQGLFGAALVQG